jgi:hypothetical protein
MSAADMGGATSRRSGGVASPGVPDSADAARMAELEARLAKLEGGPGIKERGRNMMDRVMPPEATRHFLNAGREQLLGIRTIVDFWIRRIDDVEAKTTGDPKRQSIEVE